MKDRQKPDKFLLPHRMPSDDRACACSSRVFPKAAQIKAPYKLWHYQHYAWDVTPRASVSLLLVQPQPLLLGGCPSHWLCLALRPVLAQGWVLGGMPPC